MTTPWMLDEHAHAGPEHLDPDFVSGYDRKQGYPDFGDDIETLRRHGVGESATVVDLGTGTGRFALAAAEQFGRVVAVDLSEVMIDHLRERATAAGVVRLECVRAGFLSYVHAGDPAHAVYTRNALHHLPDFWKAIALQRIADMLRPGGVLRLRDLIYGFQPRDADQVFEQWFGGAADDPATGYTAAEYAEHIQTEYSTFSWLLEPMLENAGFDIVEADRGEVFGAYTCVRRG